MIKIERPATGPSALEKLYGDSVKPPRMPGKSESETVRHRYDEWRVGPRVKPFEFPFKRYSDREVVAELQSLFHGKCAYCESHYAGTQPMDVEHWRPKGGVLNEETRKLDKPGYYWLASAWGNLLPSCIDCNRGRKQYDKYEKVNLTLGKKNQFPRPKGVARVEDHRSATDIDTIEKPLLLNPCVDDPEEFLIFDHLGVVLPRSQDDQSEAWARAMASIRVYALNRAGLVARRAATQRLVSHRIDQISKLGEIRQHVAAADQPRWADALSDLIDSEVETLKGLRDARHAYAGMVRQLIQEADELIKKAQRR